jgi:hypothetical protein
MASFVANHTNDSNDIFGHFVATESENQQGRIASFVRVVCGEDAVRSRVCDRLTG